MEETQMTQLTQRSIAVGLALTCLLVPIGSAVAQSDAKALIAQAYQKTKEAKTVSELTVVIDLCQRARQADANESQIKYLTQLLGWSHNKRGEAIIEQSLAALEANDQRQAIALDAEALADFEKSVEYTAGRWKSLHNRGVGYALIDKFVKAIEDFDAVIELKPDYTNAWFNRAEIRYELDQLDLAIEDYTEVLRQVPGDFGAYSGRGHANFRAGRIRVALNDYEYAASLDPSNADALVNRGRARHKLGMWELAAEDFREAIERDARSASAYQAAAWLMATCPDERYRNQKLGLHAAKKVVELAARDSLTARHLDTLAAALANAGQFEEARERLKQALKRATAEEAIEFQQRLALYEVGEPFREGLPTGAGQEG
jgi:tetratricopeptide (TPR) repeat protein